VAKEVFGGLFPPQPFLPIDAGPGHDDMNVRVIVQASAMSMEDGGKSRFAPELFIVSSKALEGIPDRVKHEGIDRLLVSPGQIPQLSGQGEGNQVIPNRQPIVQLRIDPLRTFVVLEMGAIPVSAGVGNIGKSSAPMV
jgi:hypothetical protein